MPLLTLELENLGNLSWDLPALNVLDGVLLGAMNLDVLLGGIGVRQLEPRI